MDGEKLSDENQFDYHMIAPERGRILDRNGIVLARNDGGFYLELQPSKIKNLNITIEKLKHTN